MSYGEIVDASSIACFQLVALSAWSLTAFYGPIYLNNAKHYGWGSCHTGFVRYARDMFFKSLCVAVLFGSWGLQMWYTGVTPVSERPFGWLIVGVVPVMAAIYHDLVAHVLRETRWAWCSYLVGASLVIGANLSRLLLFE
jgi:hypothetical protein